MKKYVNYYIEKKIVETTWVRLFSSYSSLREIKLRIKERESKSKGEYRIVKVTNITEIVGPGANN